MILFLDFDGVLHPLMAKDDQHFCFMPRLACVLREYPHVRVVVTSSWRLRRSLDVLKAFFPADVREQVVGMTPVEESLSHQVGSREQAALAWLDIHEPGAPWLALDDYAPGWITLWRVVLCQDGFFEAEERQLRNLLRAG